MATGSFVELPVNASEDQVLGSLDFDRTIAGAAPVFQPGLLARAHLGVLYCDNVNLLDDRVAAHVAAALDTGVVRVEREGVSAGWPAEFVFIGTYDEAEGPISPLLRDRVGLIVDADEALSLDERAEVIETADAFARHPAEVARQFEEGTDRIRRQLIRARRSVAGIKLSSGHKRRITESAARLGINGHAVDLFTVRAARALAALSGRRRVIDEDVEQAIGLVMVPRSPYRERPPENGAAHERPRAEPDVDSAPGEQGGSAETQGGEPTTGGLDILAPVVDARMPGTVFTLDKKLRRSTSGRRRLNRQGSGRYSGSTDRRPDEPRIAIDATLRAYAANHLSRKRTPRVNEGAVGGRARPMIDLGRDDLRYKVLKGRAGIHFVFAVDASGSMALNRMAHAKGALIRLLQEAYLKRDLVTLVAFRGKGAEVLLPPTRSVARARGMVEAVPLGGATPMAAGLVTAMEVARSARLRHRSQTMIVLMTDGRSNVEFADSGAGDRADRKAAIDRELIQVGESLAREGIGVVVIDTRHEFVSGGEARALAGILGARYAYLPHLRTDAVYHAVTSAAETLRSKVRD
jgi:magnesium chelatase subunit D